MRCNIRDNLVQLSFFLKTFGDLYITQSNIYDGAFLTKIVNR